MIELVHYSPEQWYAYSEAAHKLVFKEKRAPGLDRISYALLAVRGPTIFGYVTCRETDSESIYWQFGGCLDEQRGFNAVKAFQALLDDARSRYKRCSTLVENDNIRYLHLLMKHGFRVIGCRYFNGDILLELFQEFDHAISQQSTAGLSVHASSRRREEVRRGDAEGGLCADAAACEAAAPSRVGATAARQSD